MHDVCVCVCFGGMYHSLHVEPKEELCRVGSLTFMWVHSQKVTYFNLGPQLVELLEKDWEVWVY